MKVDIIKINEEKQMSKNDKKEVEVHCSIERIVRSSAKQFAEVVVLIPNAIAGDIPMGQVVMTIKPKQIEMFPVEKNKK